MDNFTQQSSTQQCSTQQCFTKQYIADEFGNELIKARLLHERSQGSLFTAPAVIANSSNEASIQYELVDCSQSLMDVLGAADRSRESILSLLSTVGRCLGQIHQIPVPPESVEFQRSDLFANALAARTSADHLDSEHCVLQHGDFGFTNIFVTNGQDLVVIDPSPNQYTSVHVLNIDYPELDLAILVAHLVGRAANPVALGRSAVFGRAMIDAVIAGYELAGTAIDRDRLRLYTRAGIDAVRNFASDGSQAHRRAILKPLSAVLARNIS